MLSINASNGIWISKFWGYNPTQLCLRDYKWVDKNENKIKIIFLLKYFVLFYCENNYSLFIESVDLFKEIVTKYYTFPQSTFKCIFNWVGIASTIMQHCYRTHDANKSVSFIM